MHIRIDNSSVRPVYQQIIDQVKRDIALGRLLKSEKLPTVRDLASQLAINPNTIAKAYRQMEQDGVITTRAGSGAFVADIDNNLNMSVRKKIICDELDRIAVEAFHMQIDNNKLWKWFEEILQKYNLKAAREKSNE
jgi:GntR family transcriptional regulator